MNKRDRRLAAGLVLLGLLGFLSFSLHETGHLLIAFPYLVALFSSLLVLIGLALGVGAIRYSPGGVYSWQLGWRRHIQRQQQALLTLCTDRELFQQTTEEAIDRIADKTLKTLKAKRCQIWFQSSVPVAGVTRVRGRASVDSDLRSTNCELCPNLIRSVSHDRTLSSSIPFNRKSRGKRPCGARTILQAPIRLRGEAVGVICVGDSRALRYWLPSERVFLASVADLVSMRLQSAEQNTLMTELSRKSSALDASINGVGILNAHNEFVVANQALRDLRGLSSDSPFPQSLFELFTPADRVALAEDLLPRLHRDGKVIAELEGLRNDQSTFPVELTLMEMPKGDYACVLRDISPRKRAERDAQELGLFVTLSPTPILRFDSEGKLLTSNPAAQEMLGAIPGSEVHLPELLGFSLEELRECIEAGRLLTRTRSIGKRHFRFTIRGIPHLGYGHAYSTDVTDLKEAESQLISSESILRAVFDTAPNMIFVKSREGRFRLANKALADTYGTPIDELIGKTDADFNQNAEEVKHFLKHDQAVIDYGRELLIPEEEVTGADGVTKWYSTVKRPLRLPSEKETYVLGVATDISEQRELRDQLVQVQKMEAIGRLAGGIAHDFNNLLTGILGYASLLKLETPSPENTIQAANNIELAATKATQLTQKLLGFARKGKHQNVHVDIHQTIEETLGLVGRTFEGNISISTDLTASRPFVLGDPVQLQQVILNLAINARDAMTPESGGSQGGRLVFSSRNVTTQSRDHHSGESTITPEIEISVVDSGCGIPDDIRERIFDPFFTTKEEGQGTGMGLAMVYGIVRNHNGSIKVSSQVGCGTTFRLTLPVAVSRSLPSLAPIRNVTPITGEGSILLVDDHQVILDVTQRMLTSIGYVVSIARHGGEALRIFKQHRGLIDLVILDMVMPGMDARECFRQLRMVNPAARVVLSSGYGHNHRVQSLLQEGMVGFVQKPYELGEISRVISKALLGAEPESIRLAVGREIT